MSKVNPKKTARIAGLFFLSMVVFGLFSEIFVRQKLIVTGDAVATASNILSNAFLYRLGIASDILMSLSYLFTSFALYCLLVSVNKKIAGLMVIFAGTGCILLMFNVLNEAVPLYLLQGSDYLSVFSQAQLQALSMFFYELYGHGYMIGQIFFALWVLPLGVLIYQSRFIPKIFGIFFLVEVVFALIAVFVHFLIPNAMVENLLLVPGIVAEFGFLFYLLFRGVETRKIGN